MEQIQAAFQVFRVVTAASMDHSTALGTAAPGGVLQSIVQALSGPATCTTSMELWPETTMVMR